MASRILAFVMLLIGTLPITIMASGYAGMSNSIWLWSIGLHALAISAGFWLSILYSKARLRIAVLGLASLAGLFTLGKVWTLYSGWWWIVQAAVLAGLWVAGLRMSSRSPGMEAATTIWLALGGMHAFAAVISRFASIPLPAIAITMLGIISPAYFMLVALLLNNRAMSSGAASRRTGRVSSLMRSRNIALVFGAAALTLVAANIGAIGAAARQAFTYIITGILWLFSKFAFTQGSEQGGGGGGDMSLAGLGEPTEPSLLAIIFERIFIVLAIIIAVALVILAIRIMWKKIARLFNRIIQQLKRFVGELNQGYTEVSERVFDMDELTNAAMNRIRKLIPRRLPKWSDLDNRARVRLTISALLMKRDLPGSTTISHALSHGDLTAAPADPTMLAEAYDAARYSSSAIPDAAADNARLAFNHRRR